MALMEAGVDSRRPGEMQQPQAGPPRASFLSQLNTMLRRNLLLKTRSKKMTIAEIAIPCLLLAEFALLGKLTNLSNTAYPGTLEYADEPIYFPKINSTHANFYVGVTPNTPDTQQIMAYAGEYWRSLQLDVDIPSELVVYFFPTEAHLEKFYLNSSSLENGAGIVFARLNGSSLDYALRFPADESPPSSRPFFRPDSGCRPYADNATVVETPRSCSTNRYASSGFVALQNVLAAAYAKAGYNISIGPLSLFTKMLPDAPYSLKGSASDSTFSASMMSSILTFFVIFLVVLVVTEKQKKHIASMEIMGLRPAVYWLSWITLYLLIMLIFSVLGVFLGNYFKIWPESCVGLLLTDCMVYGGSLIAIGICLAALFNRPTIAGLIAYAVITALGYLYMLEENLPNMSSFARWALALISPSAFFLSLSRVSAAEAKGFGIGFGNSFSDSEHSLTFGHCLIMLFVDVALYSLLAVYLQKVFPSDDSPRERACFCFYPPYWSRNKATAADDAESVPLNAGDIEAVPVEVRAKSAITTHALRKVFAGTKDTVAVSGFTYEMYEDEILAILGHNGAGKTTLINMIIGMLAPTSGRVVVYGNDMTVAAQRDAARAMIGICPQHDVLFDAFTVREHLEFYGRLKGFSASQARIEAARMIDQIDLRDHANVQAQKLSGGQKRRLSIAIAVVGNPKILILDEPTSGVDPYSRRAMWDMIRGFRKGRCIILTTQSMQEADVFADRKLIISHGRLRCAGTSLFLKNRFGLGYHLTMSVDRDFDERQVEEFVTSQLTGAYKARAHAGEMSFVLPKAGVAQFPSLFDALDTNLTRLKILTYGVTLSTMEEIFLRLADETADELAKQDGEMNFENQPFIVRKHNHTEASSMTFSEPVKGAVSCWTKFVALCKIRFLLLLRSKMFLVFGVLIPLLLIVMNGVMALVAQYSASTLTATDALSIDGLTQDFRETGTKFFFANKSGSTGSVDSLISSMSAGGVEFEAANYSTLLESGLHYGGILFGKKTGENLKDATIAYNGSAIHVIPYLANLLLTAHFRILTGGSEVFRVVSHAFPAKSANSLDLVNYAVGTLLIGIAVSLIPGAYGVDVCRDRQIKIRGQIRVTGCSAWLYWGSALTVHFLLFTMTFLMILVSAYAFGMTAVTDAIGCVSLLFALHAPAMILFSYCLSFCFKKHETAAAVIPYPISMLAFICYLTVMILDVIRSQSATTVHTVFALLLPCYGFFGGLYFIQKVGIRNAVMAHQSGARHSYFDWDTNIPIVLIAHTIHIVLLTGLVAYLECRYFNQSILQFFGCPGETKNSVFSDGSTHSADTAKEDDDVKREKELVKSTNLSESSTSAVLVRGLWKVFSVESSCFKLCRGRTSQGGPHGRVVVRDVSLLLPKGEVFGLLGPNGAGKTTTLSMLTGEISPSAGDIHINGHNIHTQTNQAIETMGSCPQIDTLWDDITMREHFDLFAVLNDLAPDHCASSIKIFSEGLNITEHMAKKAAALSGGTKRKATFVISMIGNPPLVLLDEPSTGMDPQSKRNLWDMIQQSCGRSRSAILTTHSMEEADALCDRIGILVKGQLQCLGTSQHLKDKFGSGYVLEVKLAQEAITAGGAAERVKNRLVDILPGISCVEEVYNRLVFSVPKDRVTSLGAVFTGLDRVKQELNLEEYSFSQTTIEQVFLHFAKMQNDELPVALPPSLNVVDSNV